MDVQWNVWVNARSEKAARKIYARLHERLGCDTTRLSIEPYPKTQGHTINFQTTLTAGSPPGNRDQAHQRAMSACSRCERRPR
jgi:hypothetical protein